MTDAATDQGAPKYADEQSPDKLTEKVAGQAQDQVKKVADLANQASKAVTDRAGAARDWAGERAGVAKDWALDQSDVIRDTVQTKPLISVGVSAASAFAAGLVLGVLLTRR